MSFPALYLPATAPEYYDQLAKLYWPHPLRDDLGYEQALKVIGWLAPQAYAKDQRCFLWIMRDLVKTYERQRGVPGPHLQQVWPLAQEQ